SRKRYSALRDQLSENAYSRPPPAVQPMRQTLRSPKKVAFGKGASPPSFANWMLVSPLMWATTAPPVAYTIQRSNARPIRPRKVEKEARRLVIVSTLDGAANACPGTAVTGKFTEIVSSIPAQLLSLSQPHTQLPYWMLQPEVMPAVPLLISLLKWRARGAPAGGGVEGGAGVKEGAPGRGVVVLVPARPHAAALHPEMTPRPGE